MSRHRIKAYFTLLVVSAIWGIATPVIKFTLQAIEPSSFLTYRFFIASIVGVALLFFTARKHIRRIRHRFKIIFFYSILSTTIALGLLFLGLNNTSVLDTVLITSVSPLVTAVFGNIFLNETITRQEKIGIGIAFLGSIFIIAEPLFMGKINLVKLSGNVLVLGYLLANGYSAILSKKIVRKDISAFNLSNISFIIGFLTILPIALISLSPHKIIDNAINLQPQYQFGVIYMALISGTIAYALWIKGQKSIEVSEAGLFAYLNPIFAAPLAIFWLGESITLAFIIGALIVLTGVAIAEYK